jgi:hypothetical protein
VAASAKEIPLTAGPWKGMRYKSDPDSRRSDLALFAQDMIPMDPVHGGPYLRRPSDQSTTIKTGSTTTLQHMGVFKKRSGFVGVSIVDGEIYTLSGTTWTRQVTTANLTTGSITLSATARVHCVSFNNTYVVNDGVNQPFTWDGTSGASGLTLLSNAPTKCYGKPTVYFGKLFFIKDVAASSADRSKIVWSEEYAANTGYEASNYTNVWTLEQSGSGALYAIRGTNSGLYYFRQDAIGVITGAVGPAFQTSGVHDDVSALVGTTCPDVLWYDKYLYFFDQRGRPLRLPEGGVVEDLYRELSDFYVGPDTPGQGLVNLTAFDGAKSNIAAYPWLDAVLFAPFNTTFTNQPVNWLFSHRSGGCLCRMTPGATTISNTAITGMSYDSTNGRTVIAMGGVANSNAYAILSPVVSGNFYDHTDGGTPLFPRYVIVGQFGGGDDVVWKFSKVSVLVGIGATASARTGTVGISTAVTENPYDFTGGSGGNKTFPASATYQTQVRKTVGVEHRQRLMAVSIGDSGGFEGWGVNRVTVIGVTEPMEADKT